MKNLRFLMKVLKYLFVITLLVLSIGPFFWVFMSSFKSNTEILTNSLNFPKGISLTNYIMAFKISPIGQFYLNSIIVSVFGTLLNIIILSMSAYAVARFQFRGKGLLVGVLSIAILIPSAALLLPLYLTVNALGLYDKLLGLIIIYAGFGIPASLYILSSYFLTIPREMEESGYIDGSGVFRTFVKIILPIAKPGLITAAVIQFLLVCWNEFQFAMILTTGNRSRTLPLSLFYFKSHFATDYGMMFAATVSVIIPSIILYIILQEQIVSGLAAGAVKG